MFIVNIQKYMGKYNTALCSNILLHNHKNNPSHKYNKNIYIPIYMHTSSKLIQIQLNPTPNISSLVKKFITNQTDSQNPPFQLDNYSPVKRKSQKCHTKQSLSDWRVLFNVKNKNSCKKGWIGEGKDKDGRNRKYTSDRKFNITQFETPRRDSMSRENKYGMNKTSVSFRESYLESAIMQNMYEDEYIQQRKIQTAKIKRHYQKSHDERPLSINTNIIPITTTTQPQPHLKPHQILHQLQTISNKHPSQQHHDAFTQTRPLTQSNTKKGKTNNRLLRNQIWTQKYESVKIKRKYIRRYNDIVIEGLGKDGGKEGGKDGGKGWGDGGGNQGALRFYASQR